MAEGIRIEGLPELRAILKKVGSLQPVKTGMKAGANHMVGKVKREPPVSRRPVAQFWGDKQRRGFFAKLRAGEIEVPYYRGKSKGTERMRQAWTVQEQHGGLTQIIGNDTSYGPFVKQEGMQARYHKETGWTTTAQDIEANASDVVNIVKRVVDAALAGL